MNKKNQFVGKILRLSMAEFIGTFVLVFAGCGACGIMTTKDLNNLITCHLIVSIAFGLAVMCMIYSVGHISGAHLNPAVTLSFMINRNFPRKLVIPYILAQCFGGISASLMLFLSFNPLSLSHPSHLPLDIGLTQPLNGGILEGIIWEFVLTFILMFVITATATDSRAVGQMAGLAIGSTVCLLALFGGPISGASLNPARSLGPALVLGQWNYFYIYVIGPILGAIAGGYVYHLLCSDCEQCMKRFPIWNEMEVTEGVKKVKKCLETIHL
ncbi:MAG: MIP/aquaporin family protein [Candidatus Omnitrophota bacterium]